MTEIAWWKALSTGTFKGKNTCSGETAKRIRCFPKVYVSVLQCSPDETLLTSSAGAGKTVLMYFPLTLTYLFQYKADSSLGAAWLMTSTTSSAKTL